MKAVNEITRQRVRIQPSWLRFPEADWMREMRSNSISNLTWMLGEPLKRNPGDLSRVLQFQLFLNVSTVGFDCFRTYVQRFGDLANVAAFADQLENLQFPIRQQVDQVMT